MTHEPLTVTPIDPPTLRGLAPIYYEVACNKVLVIPSEFVKWFGEFGVFCYWSPSKGGWFEIGDGDRWFTKGGTTLDQLKPGRAA